MTLEFMVGFRDGFEVWSYFGANTEILVVRTIQELKDELMTMGGIQLNPVVNPKGLSHYQMTVLMNVFPCTVGFYLMCRHRHHKISLSYKYWHATPYQSPQIKA